MVRKLESEIGSQPVSLQGCFATGTHNISVVGGHPFDASGSEKSVVCRVSYFFCLLIPVDSILFEFVGISTQVNFQLLKFSASVFPTVVGGVDGCKTYQLSDTMV